MSLVRKNIIALQKAERRLEKIAQNAVRDNMEAILTILKEGQIKKGIKSDGTKISKKYADSTENYWRYADPPRNKEQFDYKVTSNTYDLDWSGNWLNQMYIKIENDGFDILSRDKKQSYISLIAGGEVNALTKENNDTINDEIIKPALFEFMLDNLLVF